jgi:hypothetical protein
VTPALVTPQTAPSWVCTFVAGEHPVVCASAREVAMPPSATAAATTAATDTNPRSRLPALGGSPNALNLICCSLQSCVTLDWTGATLHPAHGSGEAKSDRRWTKLDGRH